MTKVAREELNKLSSSITECNVIYLPQVTVNTESIYSSVWLVYNLCNTNLTLLTARLFASNPQIIRNERREGLCSRWPGICGEPTCNGRVHAVCDLNL